MGKNQGQGVKRGPGIMVDSRPGVGERGPGTRRKSGGPNSVLKYGTGGEPRLGRKVGPGKAGGRTEFRAQSLTKEGEGGPRSGPLVN